MRRRVTLGELTGKSGVQTGPFGSQLHAHEYTANGVPVVMPQDIGDNVIRTEAIARVPDDVAHRLARHRLRPGDIVYSRRGDVERRALVRREQDGWLCGTGCLRVRLDRAADADPRFLSYCLGTPAIRSWIVSHAVGGTMLNLNTGILSAVPLELPTKRQQQAIADVLGALDDKIAANDREAARADRLAEHIYQQATIACARVPASRLLTPVLGGTPDRSRPDYWRAEVPWSSARDVTAAPHGVIVETAEAISFIAATETRARAVPRGSVVLSARGTVGAVARLGLDSAFNQSCYAFLPGSMPPGCLYLLVKDAAASALSVAHGSVFSTITIRSFDAMLVPNLGGAEVEGLEARLDPLLVLVEARIHESRCLARLRDGLLPHLMSGRISVRDAEEVVSDAV